MVDTYATSRSVVKISIAESEGISILSFTGNLDTSSSPDAENTINGLIDDGGKKLLIDFENLDYISSAGLRILLATSKRLGREGGTLRICGLNATVREVFDISGFATILNVFSNQAEALQDFG
jgi:anti-anti-sigma factor